MNHIKTATLLLLGVIIISCKSSYKGADSTTFIQLFSEDDTNREIVGDASWRYEGNVIIGYDGGSGFMVTREAYDDFELTAEFYPDSDINSGIFIRCPKGEFTATGCYEINIWDNHVNQDFRTGSIVTRGKPLALVNSVDKWNTYRIRASGDHIEVWLNDIKTADIRDQTSSAGHVALQVNGQGTIQFRNVRLTPLK